MPTDRGAALSVLAAAALLLWPALWNGYPIVFTDTGTYLSQAIHLYAGWDRPVFYSLFMLPLHATVTTWPVVVAQALLTAWLLRLVCRVLLPGVSPMAFLFGVAAMAVCTWLPWLVSELMPDLFTPLLVLVLCILALAPERVAVRELWLLVALAAFMIATQLSSLPLSCGLLAVLALVFRRVRMRWRLLVLPPALAILGLCSVNLAAHGRFAVSPFGNVFLLARVIYDGPGMGVLRRDCPASGWRLCPFLDAFPATSDDFLWSPGSPLERAGGPKLVSAEAGAIIARAVVSEPIGVGRAAVANMLEQLGRFESGDGLQPWPDQVTPWIRRDFPASEQVAYGSALQQRGLLAVPPVLGVVHRVVACGGVAACVLLLPLAFRRRSACLGFLVAVVVALPLSAAITGALSTPHDRYQSRIMWLAPFIAAVSLFDIRTSCLGCGVEREGSGHQPRRWIIRG
jgi:hypothetical protein